MLEFSIPCTGQAKLRPENLGSEHNPNTPPEGTQTTGFSFSAGGVDGVAVATAVRAAVLDVLRANPGDWDATAESCAYAATQALELLAGAPNSGSHENGDSLITPTELRVRRLGNLERLLVDAKDNFWYAPGSTWKRQGISALVAAMDLVGLMAREENT